jgi:hypothetical protein
MKPLPTGRQAVPTEGGIGRGGGDMILFIEFVLIIQRGVRIKEGK